MKHVSDDMHMPCSLLALYDSRSNHDSHRTFSFECNATSIVSPYHYAVDLEELNDVFTKLNCSTWDIKDLEAKTIVSFQISSLLPGTKSIPDSTDLNNLARFMRSLLETLDFAHSRNIMNLDLAEQNVLFDATTGTTYLPDWNDATFFAPNLTMTTYRGQQTPEAQEIDLPVHATVSSVDVYDAGLLLKRRLCRHTNDCHEPPKTTEDRQVRLAYDLMLRLLTEDPFERPTAGDLLNHAFLQNATGSVQ